jgi:hypothetical protein
MQIIREFKRLHELATAAGTPFIPTPTSTMVSSYCAHQRFVKRGGLAVGGVSLQSVQDLADNLALRPTTGENEGYCVKCTIDCERDEPFFALLLSTKNLMKSFDSSKPIETDETFKVMHEGYALTLIGQSDANRVWHLRYCSNCSNLRLNYFFLYLIN